jgi:hypothetical protein
VRLNYITARFVEFIPELLDDGVLYVSEVHGTAIHKCCCGCGEEVVTPLTPADWHLRKEGGTVTLTPSIGNWNYACQSHYWIRKNRVEWAPRMTGEEIFKVQAHDKLQKKRYIARRNAQRPDLAWTARLWARTKTWWPW